MDLYKLKNITPQMRKVNSFTIIKKKSLIFLTISKAFNSLPSDSMLNDLLNAFIGSLTDFEFD